MNKLYAGIGSRKTPDNIMRIMTKIAKKLNSQGYILRSGGAQGADSAFESGANNLKEIFMARDAIPEAIKLASKFHPAWHKCNDYARKLHGRNAMIILGKDLITPVEFTVCYTPGGKVVGGTGLGLRICAHYNIEIKNLYDKNILNELINRA